MKHSTRLPLFYVLYSLVFQDSQGLADIFVFPSFLNHSLPFDNARACEELSPASSQWAYSCINCIILFFSNIKFVSSSKIYFGYGSGYYHINKVSFMRNRKLSNSHYYYDLQLKTNVTNIIVLNLIILWLLVNKIWISHFCRNLQCSKASSTFTFDFD